jgi:hypothetical protein
VNLPVRSRDPVTLRRERLIERLAFSCNWPDADDHISALNVDSLV